MECPNCHQMIPDGTPFCTNCGTPLSPQSTMPQSDFTPEQPTSVIQSDYVTQPATPVVQPEYDATQPTPGAPGNFAAAQTSPAPEYGYQQTPPSDYAYQQQQSIPYAATDFNYQQPAQQAGYQQQYPGQQPYMPTPQNPANGKATGALICGIFALLTALCGWWVAIVGPIIGLVLSVVALILGASALKIFPDGKAKAGKIMGIIGIVLNVLILVLTLVGCAALIGASGNGNSSNPITIPGITSESAEGTWYIKEMASEGEIYDEDTIGMMYAIGIDLKLELSDSGRASLSIYSESEIGTWTQDGNKVTIDMNGETISGSMDGSKLVMYSDDGQTSITFDREKPEFDAESMNNLNLNLDLEDI